MFIDTHVHCRDWEESHKATIKSVTELARRQGVVAIFDMPNTEPPIISTKRVEERLELAKREGCLEGYYLWVGVTKNPDQIREVARIVETNPHVVGIKMYAGTSVGDLAIIDEQGQRTVYRELTKANYRGVLAVHCEKEDLFKMHLWNPNEPSTWGLARPPEAEAASIQDQIKFAKECGFEGTLYVAHISTPEGVSIVNNAKREMKIKCAVTPHHLTLGWDDMDSATGLQYKVNPPLRDSNRRLTMNEFLKSGYIDWLETDHAPHTHKEKFNNPYMSGISSLQGYAQLISGLRKQMSEEQIANLTYHNIKKVFPKVLE